MLDDAPRLLPTLHRADLRRQVNQGRIYVWPPGDLDDGTARRYVSVTTALRAIPKEALVYWSAKVVAETAVGSYELLGKLREDDETKAIAWLKGAPWSRRDQAGLTGTLLHELMEYWLAEDAASADELIRSLDVPGRAKARQLRGFLDAVPFEVLDIESVVFSEVYGYAGTTDLLVRITNEQLLTRLAATEPVTMILDVKSGKGIYPETALQLAAYRYASHILDLGTGVRTEMPQIDGAAVVHLTETSWALIPVVSDPDTFQSFLAALVLSGYLPLEETLIGLPIMRGRQ